MRILIADDDAVMRRLLMTHLQNWGHEVSVAEDGDQAWQKIRSESSTCMAILDWSMPGVDGVELCRRVREDLHIIPCYIILLTARGGKENLLKGLESGADDFMIKPFDKDLLRGRLEVGIRSVEFQSRLCGRVAEAEENYRKALQLREKLPVCVKCKRLCDDEGVWHRVGALVESDMEGDFAQLLCPNCKPS